MYMLSFKINLNIFIIYKTDYQNRNIHKKKIETPTKREQEYSQRRWWKTSIERTTKIKQNIQNTNNDKKRKEKKMVGLPPKKKKNSSLDNTHIMEDKREERKRRIKVNFKASFFLLILWLTEALLLLQHYFN